MSGDDKDIDPGIRGLFPWVLFLVLALAFAACAFWVGKTSDYACYGHDRAQAIFDKKPPCVHPTFEDRAREFFNQSPQRFGENGGDPYACFGGGRYDAMRSGRVCPGFDGEK
jgi:hypothetical protein